MLGQPEREREREGDAGTGWSRRVGECVGARSSCPDVRCCYSAAAVPAQRLPRTTADSMAEKQADRPLPFPHKPEGRGRRVRDGQEVTVMWNRDSVQCRDGSARSAWTECYFCLDMAGFLGSSRGWGCGHGGLADSTPAGRGFAVLQLGPNGSECNSVGLRPAGAGVGARPDHGLATRGFARAAPDGG